MIQQLWRDNPRSNIGVRAGANFWVLDIDPRHGGDESLAELEIKHGELPRTLTARTPSGGMHYYFHPASDIRNSAGRVGQGIDVRGHGGYVCVEGSRVGGSSYEFQDWDPLTDGAPELAAAPRWLTDLALAKNPRPAPSPGDGVKFSEGGRNDALTREAGKLRRVGMTPDVIEAALQRINLDHCSPPLDAGEVTNVARSVGRYVPSEPTQLLKDPPPAEPQENLVKWRELATKQPPPFKWLIDHWLSWHPTLLSGRGGIGKSLLAQQLATGLATGRPVWSTSCEPVNVLYWACEDDHDEIWRRQDRICRSMGLGFDALDELHIDARCGLSNSIFATDFGRPALQPLFGKLMQQINDLRISVLILDNIAQTFGGNENDRHHVTMFLNAIIGIVRGRPFCPMILGHIAKSPTSEYSGSTAWENAARMRWYLGEKLPGEAGADQTEPATEASETRFLCKRKTNYSANDYVQFTFDAGVFTVKQQVQPIADHGTMAHLDSLRAKTVVLQAAKFFAERGIRTTEGTKGPYLPRKILEYKKAEGFSPKQLATAMVELIADQKLVIGVVGKNSNRTPMMGLLVAE